LKQTTNFILFLNEKGFACVQRVVCLLKV